MRRQSHQSTTPVSTKASNMRGTSSNRNHGEESVEFPQQVASRKRGKLKMRREIVSRSVPKPSQNMTNQNARAITAA